MQGLFSVRYRAAGRVAFLHALGSVVIGLVVGALVFLVWYPYPYSEMAGGKDLFQLLIWVDVVAGPLLTFFLYNPIKRKSELILDLGLVACLQLTVLCYGAWTVWEARPLFLVAEIDRFKVIGRPQLLEGALSEVDVKLKPGPLQGPTAVAIREPVDSKERETVLFESLLGGRDYGERPNFYIPYGPESAKKLMARARPMDAFLANYPDQQPAFDAIATGLGVAPGMVKYVPVAARQSWVALVDPQGKIIGFLKGDGF